MKLYIANTTRQVQHFAAAVPEIKGTKVQEIPIGAQVSVFGDLNLPQIVAIIEQHEKYGLVKAEDVDRTKPFIGMCYSIDKPVSGARIYAAMEHNNEVLKERGKELRKQAAVSINNQIEANLNRQNEDRPPGASETSLRDFEMSVVEETRHDRENAEDPLAEGIKVARNEGQPRPPRKARNK